MTWNWISPTCWLALDDCNKGDDDKSGMGGWCRCWYRVSVKSFWITKLTFPTIPTHSSDVINLAVARLRFRFQYNAWGTVGTVQIHRHFSHNLFSLSSTWPKVRAKVIRNWRTYNALHIDPDDWSRVLFHTPNHELAWLHQAKAYWGPEVRSIIIIVNSIALASFCILRNQSARWEFQKRNVHSLFNQCFSRLTLAS